MATVSLSAVSRPMRSSEAQSYEFKVTEFKPLTRQLLNSNSVTLNSALCII